MNNKQRVELLSQIYVNVKFWPHFFPSELLLSFSAKSDPAGIILFSSNDILLLVRGVGQSCPQPRGQPRPEDDERSGSDDQEDEEDGDDSRHDGATSASGGSVGLSSVISDGVRLGFG